MAGRGAAAICSNKAVHTAVRLSALDAMMGRPLAAWLLQVAAVIFCAGACFAKEIDSRKL